LYFYFLVVIIVVVVVVVVVVAVVVVVVVIIIIIIVVVVVVVVVVVIIIIIIIIIILCENNENSVGENLQTIRLALAASKFPRKNTFKIAPCVCICKFVYCRNSETFPCHCCVCSGHAGTTSCA